MYSYYLGFFFSILFRGLKYLLEKKLKMLDVTFNFKRRPNHKCLTLRTNPLWTVIFFNDLLSLRRITHISDVLSLCRLIQTDITLEYISIKI